MIYITSHYLRALIKEELRSTIELYRQSKRTYYFDGDYYVADQELEDFIFSIPYFSYDLKEFIRYSWGSVFIGVTKEWYYQFLECIYLWSESDEWLYDDMMFTRDPTLGNNDKNELDLTPHNKAVFYCVKYF